VDYPRAWTKLERNVVEAAAYGALFEVNAAAFRKGWESAYPGEDVVQVGPTSSSFFYYYLRKGLMMNVIFFKKNIQLIRKHKGRFAMSDDSHGPHAVALNYDKLYSYLRRVGVDELWYLRESDQPNAGGRFVKAVKVDGSWWEHSSWEGISGEK